MLPNLICPGASKSATTTLCDILKESSDVYTGIIKEPHFFDTDDFYKGIEFYESQYYPEPGSVKIVADFTPSYLHCSVVAERIKETLGNKIKIIILLRNPIDRAFSAYLFMKQRGEIKTKNFNDYLDLNINKKYYENLKEGLYYNQVKEYYNLFPKNYIKIFIFEDFISNMQKNVDKITDFLGIDRILVKSKIHSNKTRISKNIFGKYYLILRNRLQKILKPIRRGKKAKYLFNYRIIKFIKNIEKRFFDIRDYKPAMSYEHRKILKEYYGNDVKKLKRLTKIKFDEWVDFL
jgi:hypothetical protein